MNNSVSSLLTGSLWRTMRVFATGDRIMNEPGERLVIVDVRIPFFRLVLFFIKAVLAAIPAAIVVALITAIIVFLAANIEALIEISRFK
jgi:hypothetical protein